jgi:hypothetical protein
MKLLQTLRRWRWRYFSVVLIAVIFGSFGVWRSLAVPKQPLGSSIHESIKRGLGSEVKFASPGDSKGQIVASVESVDNFLFQRAGLRMSKETKERLATMEENTLNGTTRRLSTDDIVLSLTGTINERLSYLTDQEIDFAERMMQKDGSLVLPRRSAETAVTPEEFVTNARQLRDNLRRGSEVARDMVQHVVDESIYDRLSLFAEAVPEKFAGGSDSEFTPLQALVLSYSIVADDNLSGSSEELRQAGISAKANGRKAFGKDGHVFRAPIDFIFNRKTSARLLENLERRSRQ